MTLDASSPPLLRQALRQARRMLSDQQQTEHAQALAHLLLSFLSHASPQAIGVAAAFDSEIDPLFAVMALQAAGHRTYLPILRADKQLDFALWHADSVMVTNQFGILEPSDPLSVSIEVLDILLVPLVGVDRQGNRLGMGGGYYDRTLGNVAKRPYLIGIAHQCQLVDTLPSQPWDVPLDALVTEESVIVWRDFNQRVAYDLAI